MEKEENTVDPQDEQKDEDTFEVDEDESTEDGDESNQHHDDDVEHLKTELEQERAERAKLQRLLKKASKSEDKPKEDDTNGVTREDLERVRLEARGFDDEQVSFLMKFGGSKATKDEAVMQVVSAMKEKKQQLDAQAKSSSQSKTSRRYSQDDLRNMPLDKLEKLIREGKIK